MWMDPSHLARLGSDDDAVREHRTGRGAVVLEVTVTGRWDRQLEQAVQHTVRGGLAAGVAAMIFDLHHLTDVHTQSTPTWLAVHHAARRLNPPPQLALSLPPTRQLARHLREVGARRHLLTFSTIEQARSWVLGLSDALTVSRVEVRAAPRGT